MHDRVHKIIRDHLDPSKPLTAETRFADDLGADSLDMLELSMAFEDEFGIAIPDDDLDDITTVGQAVEYIERRTA